MCTTARQMQILWHSRVAMTLDIVSSKATRDALERPGSSLDT